MNKIILPAVLAIALAVPGMAFAGNELVACSVNDIVLESDPEGFVEVVACAGAIKNNDETNGGWLEDLNVWQDNGDNDLLTNVNGGTTEQTWTYLTKYLPDGSYEGDAPNIDNIFTVAFTDCEDAEQQAVTCDTDAEKALALNINFNTTATELTYNQFVFSAKAGSYFSLYQVQVLEGIQSITGTLSMVSQQGLSHLTVYASNFTAPGPQVEVSAPATAGLLLTGLVSLRLRRRKGQA